MEKIWDFLIIGAGPGGLQLGFFFHEAGRDYLILEAGEAAGTFFERYPRHRKLLSINKVHTGYSDPKLNFRWDWNSLLSESDSMLFKNYSKRFFPDADDMVRYLRDFSDRQELNVRYRTEVSRISRNGDGFAVEDHSGGRYLCKNLILATGVFRAYVPRIPGIELAENYTEMSLEPEDFANQRVLIVGKGNSAFETAEHLIEHAASIHLASPGNLKLAWKSHHVGHLRAVNNNFLDTYLLKSQNGLLEADIKRIQKREDGKFAVEVGFTRARGAGGSFIYDRVIVCTGFRFDDSAFDASCKPRLALKDRFPEQDCHWESTNVKNLYFAGTLMQMRDYKKTQSSFIHGFRYNIRALFRMLEIAHSGKSWPGKEVSADPDTVCGEVLDRINRSAALWHQPGFLCDLFVVDDEGEGGRYYQELPVDYVRESGFNRARHAYMITLEYGPDHPDFPFDFQRYPNAEHAHLNPQLHPIVRRLCKGEVVAEHHVLEELEGRWLGTEFVDPLHRFLDAQLAPIPQG